MKQKKPEQVSSKSGPHSRIPGVDSVREVLEMLAFFRDITQKTTDAEMLGWPEWRQWF